jgi:hypothetical protein
MAQRTTLEHLPDGRWQINFPWGEAPVILPADSVIDEIKDEDGNLESTQVGNVITSLDFENTGTRQIYFYDMVPGEGFVGREILPDAGGEDMQGERERALEHLEAAFNAIMGAADGEAAAIAEEQADIAQDAAIRAQEAANTSEAGIGLMSRSSSQETVSSEPGETGGRRRKRKTRRAKKNRRRKTSRV